MKDITVKKTELLAALREQRAEHKDEYDRAVIRYRERYVEEAQKHVDRAIRHAARGEAFVSMVHLPIPEIHLDDYDRAIAMMEWEQDDTIKLSEQDFGVYVLGQWSWAKSFATSTSSYNQR